jgi:hypothetical protein
MRRAPKKVIRTVVSIRRHTSGQKFRQRAPFLHSFFHSARYAFKKLTHLNLIIDNKKFQTPVIAPRRNMRQIGKKFIDKVFFNIFTLKLSYASPASEQNFHLALRGEFPEIKRNAFCGIKTENRQGTGRAHRKTVLTFNTVVGSFRRDRRHSPVFHNNNVIGTVRGTTAASGACIGVNDKAQIFHQNFLYGLKALSSRLFLLDSRQSREHISGNSFLQGRAGGGASRLRRLGIFNFEML